MKKIPWLAVGLIGLFGAIIGALLIMGNANTLGEIILWSSWAIGFFGILMHNKTKAKK